MRIFEAVLILLNLATLFLHFTKRSRSVPLWSTGANLVVLLVHSIFEGFRYQMAFSYVFVIMLVVLHS